jgi:hypothetical protein
MMRRESKKEDLTMVRKAADGPPMNKMVDGAGGEKKEPASGKVLGEEAIFAGPHDIPMDLEGKVVEIDQTVETLGLELQELSAVSDIHTREIKDLLRARGKAGTKVECQDCEAWDGINSMCCMGPAPYAKKFSDWCLAGIVSERRRAERLNREGKKG